MRINAILSAKQQSDVQLAVASHFVQAQNVLLLVSWTFKLDFSCFIIACTGNSGGKFTLCNYET